MPRNRARIAGEQFQGVRDAQASSAAQRGGSGATRGKLSKGPEWLESEEHFLQYVRALAGMLGWTSYHTRRSIGSDPGFPDLVLLRGNVQVVAELKTMKGKLTPAQEEWLAAFRAAGVPTYVWRPCDRPEIERVLGGNP